MAKKAKKSTKAKENKKFDPREDANVAEQDNKPETEVSEAQSQEQMPSDTLELISTLTSQVQQLTQQVQNLSQRNKDVSENLEEFKKESAEQRAASLAKVEKQRLSKREIMKKKWANQNKVQMFIPLEGSEKKGARFPVQANGYSYVHSDGFLGIPKGVYCAVPKGVFDIASESMNQQIENMGFDTRVDTKETTLDGGRFDPTRLER